MQEIFYEESVDTHNQASAKRRFMVYRIFSVVSFVFAVFAFLTLLYGVPIDTDEGFTAPVIISLVVWLVLMAAMIALGIFFARKKHAFYLSYDYTFISGDLRISKVFNNRRRKHLYNVPTDRIIRIGRVGSESYEKLKKSPDVKEDICTPNTEADDDKEFFYIHAQTNVGKKILVLECRIQLIYTVIRFINRPGILEPEFNKQTVSK